MSVHKIMCMSHLKISFHFCRTTSVSIIQKNTLLKKNHVNQESTNYKGKNSVATKLSMQSRNIVVILGLEKVASDWISKIVLQCKRLDGEIRACVPGPKIKDRRNTKHQSHQQLSCNLTNSLSQCLLEKTSH